MSDQMDKDKISIEAANPAPRPNNSFWLDFGPLLIFFISFQWLRRNNPDEAMLWAAGIFAVAAVLALVIGWIRHRTVSPMLLLSTAIIVVTAGLALFSGNKIIFFMKPTIVNILFGIAAIGGVMLGHNVIRLLLGDAFTLPDAAWNTLAIRWGLFFFVLAAINEVVWRTQTEEFWVGFKVFGFLPITILFTLSQIPYIKKQGGFAGLSK